MAPPTDPTGDDNMSTSTPTTTNHNISYNTEEKEYVVKFLFCPFTSKNIEVAQTHYAILQAISQIYPSTTIYNNFGRTMKSFAKVVSYTDYLRNFKLQYVKANESKNRQEIYVAYHCIRSSTPISKIKRHKTIAGLLQEVCTCMTIHHWGKEDTRIANIGFFVGVDPSNLLQDEIYARIKDETHCTTKRSIRKIPQFKCVFSSPFQKDRDGYHCTTKSYDLQCRQHKA